MAEKEEIIFIDLIKGGCAKCPHEYGNCERCYYRQEAIERMAKALVEYERTNNPNACEWSDLKEMAKDIYRERAEAALNALLGE